MLDYNPEIALLGTRIRSILKVARQQERVEVSLVAEFSGFKRKLVLRKTSGKRSDFLAGAFKSSKTQKISSKLIVSLS